MINCIQIKKEFIEEAYSYAVKSKAHTSNRHDFHDGGLEDKQQKMFEGKLGEKIFKQYMIENNIEFIVDVKTRTKEYHTRTLEMVEQFQKKPKDIYISVRLFPDDYNGFIIGWIGKNDFKSINRIENQGYLDNYVFYDNDLRDINDLIPLI